MKKFIVAMLGAFLFLSYAGTTNAVVVPSECTGMVFDNVIVGTQFGSSLQGTNQRDLIIGVGGDSIKGNGGRDCIVSGGLSSIKAGDGADVVVGKNGDIVRGENGNDTLYGGFGTKLDGGAGNDTCFGDPFSGKLVSC